MHVASKYRLLLVAVVLLAAGWSCAVAAEAGVVVISNRTAAKVAFSVARAEEQSRQYSLEAGDLVPVPVQAKAVVTLDLEGTARQYSVDPNSVYCFLAGGEQIELVKVQFAALAGGEEAPVATYGALLETVGTIPVKILVDDDEPSVRQVWEKRLTERLAQASDVFERHCRIRFEPVAVGTWESDDGITDFAQSLREFEREVNPAPARLAIGFTSQYELVQGQVHLGGTRGAMGSHILIREWPHRVSATERLEALLHELGHFLGAAHSPEADSAMRATIGDGRSNARGFRVGFDPPNTLIMNLVCEELRTRPVHGLAGLSPGTKAQLRGVYNSLLTLMPEDPAVKYFVELLGPLPSAQPEPATHEVSLIEATQKVVRAIAAAARQRGASGSAGAGSSPSGDRLTGLYVRRAAAAASQLPPDSAAKAFLLGLGIGLDESSTLRGSPIVGELCRQVEASWELRDRLAALGEPTVRGRRDLLQHFAVSCAIAALVGPEVAETVGLSKELSDSQGGSGFSFVDLAADLAGVSLASYVSQGKIPLSRLADSFAVEDFVPPAAEPGKGIAWDDFVEQFGSPEDDRFLRQQTAIRQRILALPGYRPNAQ
jgi:hypothetical protein